MNYLVLQSRIDCHFLILCQLLLLTNLRPTLQQCCPPSEARLIQADNVRLTIVTNVCIIIISVVGNNITCNEYTRLQSIRQCSPVNSLKRIARQSTAIKTRFPRTKWIAETRKSRLSRVFIAENATIVYPITGDKAAPRQPCMHQAKQSY